MRSLRGLRARLRDSVFRGRADRSMDEEVRFHLDMETERLVGEGHAPAEARRLALAAFGGVERHRQALREARRVPLLEPVLDDLRLGLRSLSKTPGLALVVTVTVAVGVAATTIVFSAANALLLRPLPVAEPDRLVSIQEERVGMVSNGIEGMLIPYDRYLAYRERTAPVLATLAAHRLVETFSLRLADETVGVNGALTSGNYFEALGVRPVLGRAYRSDAAAEIVISHDLWATRFARDPDVVGRDVGLDGRRVTVVGVAPAGFGGATLVVDHVWAPIGLRGDDQSGWGTRVVPLGRLAPGVSRARAASVVSDVGLSVPPEEHTTVRAANVVPLDALAGEMRAPVVAFLVMLQGTALIVLLVAASNIAGIMLARGFARRREMAVRLALGAGRARVAGRVLAESAWLFGAGGLIGVGAAYAGTARLARIEVPPQVPPTFFDPSPDRAVLLFALCVVVTTGLLCGLAPALQATRTELVGSLKAGGARSTATDGPLRGVFVGGQIALAVTLLLTASLFARSLQRGLGVDIGFDPRGVVAATIDLGAPLEYDRARGAAFHRELVERVRALPGVTGAALVQDVPLSGSGSGGAVRRADRPEDGTVSVRFGAVSVGYFETMGIRIAAGRAFDQGDRPGAPPVTVVNRELADRLWPGEDPVGRYVTGILGPEPVQVVGVTPTGRYGFVTERPTRFAYQPLLQEHRSATSIVARAPGAEAETLAAIAEVVHGLDPDVAVGMPLRVADLVGTGLFPQRFAAGLVGVFGAIGLLLAVLGIYGVLSHQVGRRTREIGVRRALGATSARVVWAVARRAIVLAVVGCALGLTAGAGLARLVRAFLFGVGPLDPVSFTTVPVVLLVATVAAGWVPALRATRVEPGPSLRSE